MTIESGFTWAFIFDKVVALIKYLVSKEAEQIKNRKEFFEERIEPIFEAFQKTHTDYCENLGQLMRMVRNDGGESFSDLADWLEGEHVEFAALRIQIRNLKLEVDNSAYFQAIQCHPNVIDQKIHTETLRFVTDLREYFTSSTSLNGKSWYTDFLEKLRELAERDGKVVFDLKSTSPAFRHSICKGLVDDLRIVVEKTLPNRLKRCTETYSQLRGLCLT